MDLKVLFPWIFFSSIAVLCSTQRVHNTCEICTRRPSSCRRISGLYTVTVLTEGTYNPVVEIPASACSINITELGRSRNYIGVKTASNRGIVNSYWALGQPGQYFGAGARFAYDRASGNCAGSCVYAEGPTHEKTVVQILYYGKNPGISYEFVLPNSVPFQPFEGVKSKVSGPSSSVSSSSPSSSSSALSSSTTTALRKSSSQQNRHRYRDHHRRRGHSAARPGREFYSGSQTSRSEGRPDVTAAQGSLASYRRRILPNQKNSHDYTSTKYGSHTLGGRGLSYTATSSARTRDQRRPTNQKSERYISGSSVRKVSPPQYRSPSTSNRLSYSRQQSRYQSLKAKPSYGNEVNQRTNNRYLNNGISSSRGRDSGRFRWKISGLTKCSRTCGGGVQKTNVVCLSVSNRGQIVVTSENCANSLKPRVQTVECNTSPCEPAWESDKWSECSVTCGSGTQTRKIECRQKFSPSLTLRVSADQCGLEKKPAVAQQCEKGLCSSWSSGVWGQCTKECGGGERHRDVKCVDGFDSPIPSNYCSEATPKNRESCNTQPCSAQWWTSDWSSVCSESCGTGYQVRSALCMNSDGSATSESKCRKRDFPDLTKSCYGDSGCRGTWFTGAWGRCLAKCGKGKRRRAVICLQPRQGGTIVTVDGECNPNLKPISEEPCVNTDCAALWFSSAWSKCSVTCGEGFKSRDVSCIDKDGSPSKRCAPSLRPESQEACSKEACNLYQRTDGRLVNTYNGGPETDLQESKEEADKYKDNEEDEKQEQEKIEKIGDDFELEQYEEPNVGIEPEEENPEVVDSEISEREIDDNNDNKSCTDTYWNCLMVTQSRLCQYDYYRELCCVSCRSFSHHH